MKQFISWLRSLRFFTRFVVIFLSMQLIYVLTVYVIELLWDKPEGWSKLIISNLPVTVLFSYILSRNLQQKKQK